MKAILMHSSKKCQLNVWLLSGTGDGPSLAKAFLRKGWKVSVSVVSHQASLAYLGLALENVFIGALDGVEGITSVIENTKKNGRSFDYVVDATHPFATVISTNLQIACEKLKQSLIRYERPLEQTHKGRLIKALKELEKFDLRGQKILFAIGSRSLSEAFLYVKVAGGIPFARVMPTVDGLLKSFALSIPQKNIAVLKPLTGHPIGSIETALCRRWKISGVVCRQSGGLNERVWQAICKKEKIDLWLISRPSSSVTEKAYTINDLVDKISLFHS